MKSDRQIYRRPREPQELERSYTPDRRWNWRPPLLEGILHARCLFGRIPDRQLKRYAGKPPTGFLEPDVGEPPDRECDVGLLVDTLLSTELETMWLKDDDSVMTDALVWTVQGFRLALSSSKGV